MKKLVFLLSVFIFSSMMVSAQVINIHVEEVDVTGLNPGDPVFVNVYLDHHEDVIMGWEMYIISDNTYLLPAVSYLSNKHPNFPGNWFEGMNDQGGTHTQFAATGWILTL